MNTDRADKSAEFSVFRHSVASKGLAEELPAGESRAEVCEVVKRGGLPLLLHKQLSDFVSRDASLTNVNTEGEEPEVNLE